MAAQILTAGVVIGSLYAVIVLGFTVIYKTTATVSFAQGEMVMLGAYLLSLALNWKLPLVWAILADVAAAGVFGLVVMGLLIYRPLHRESHVSLVVATVGVSFALRGMVRVLFGPDSRLVSLPFGTRPVAVGPLRLTPQDMAIVLLSWMLIAAAFLFFQRTRLGRAMRAVADNPRAAELVGISTFFASALAWTIGTALGAIGGVLLAPLAVIDPDMGGILIKAFAAAVLGGLGSLPGAVVGGMLIGILEALVAGYASAEWQPAFSFLVIIAVLLFRPQGLLSSNRTRRV